MHELICHYTLPAASCSYLFCGCRSARTAAAVCWVCSVITAQVCFFILCEAVHLGGAFLMCVCVARKCLSRRCRQIVAIIAHLPVGLSFYVRQHMFQHQLPNTAWLWTDTLLQQQSNWWSHPTFQGHLTPPQTQKVCVWGGAHMLIVFLSQQ